MDLKSVITNIPDFPVEGVMFRDITTLLSSSEAFSYAIDQFVEKIKDLNIDVILGLDARGFLVGSPVAYLLKKGIIPIRKPGKLPREVYQVEYELEYGSGKLEMHKDAIKPGQRVAILDDLLATGGTAKAACELAEMAGGEVVSLGFIIELKGLKGSEKLDKYDYFSLIEY